MCVVLDGYVIDKGTNTIIAKAYNILFEDNVVNGNENKNVETTLRGGPVGRTLLHVFPDSEDREIRRIRNVYNPSSDSSYSSKGDYTSHNKSYSSYNKGSGGSTSGW